MIRLYGPSVGNSSFVRVTKGIREALTAEDLLSGFVPLDIEPDEDAPPGYDAEIGVCTAFPTYASKMTRMGWHQKRFALVSPNSTWLPGDMIRKLEQSLTGFFSPSVWGVTMLKTYTSLPVVLWQHGISQEFKPTLASRTTLEDDYEHGYFHALHLASSPRERKGTKELLRAWCTAVKEGRLGKTPLLRLIVDAPRDYFKKTVDAYAGTDTRVLNSMVWWRSVNLDETKMVEIYRSHHLVIQPSRGEAFGMVPLEALASGTPVCLTQATGHFEYADPLPPGSVLISTGDLEPIDDGPGALAPSLSWEDVYRSLCEAYTSWHSIFASAQRNADKIREAWSWSRVTKPALEALENL